jgi:hypothetical protein
MTLVLAGTIGAVLMGALLFAPGVRDPERGEIGRPDSVGEAT